MARWYGSITDFMLCCVLSICLLPVWKLKRLFAVLAVVTVLLALVGQGLDITTKAFTESLSAINQTVGGVLFAISVVVGVVLVEWSKGKKSITVQKVLEIVGVGVFVAVGLWSLVFLFKAFVGVPNEIWSEARDNLAMVPEPRHQLKPLLFAYMKDTHQEVRPGSRAVPIIRVGQCPEKYRFVPNRQIAEWTIQEADKISDLSAAYIHRILEGKKMA